MKQKNNNICYIKSEFERRLVAMRYKERTIKEQMRIFGWVQEFLKGCGEADYSKEVGQRFIVEYTLQAHHSPHCFRIARLVVRRMDEILEGRDFTPRFAEPQPGCPSRFEKVRDEYLQHLGVCGLRTSSIYSHAGHINRFLGHLESVADIWSLTAADLYGLFTKYEPCTSSISVARRFLAYLHSRGITKEDLSVCVPQIRRPRPMPSIYSGDEISRLLAAIDRTCAAGKRDYAIIMLAAKLGLRSSDIAGLTFRGIDHERKTLNIIQEKTGRPISLVLNTDVKDALNDYIEKGRPESSSEKIFLRTKAPYVPILPGTGTAVARKYFDKAGIAPQGRRRGAHALRMSYATALVTKGVPYSIVKEALGHDDPESLKYYVRVDVRRLRACALDVPKPTGAFAVNLGDLEGGF